MYDVIVQLTDDFEQDGLIADFTAETEAVWDDDARCRTAAALLPPLLGDSAASNNVSLPHLKDAANTNNAAAGWASVGGVGGGSAGEEGEGSVDPVDVFVQRMHYTVVTMHPADPSVDPTDRPSAPNATENATDTTVDEGGPALFGAAASDPSDGQFRTVASSVLPGFFERLAVDYHAPWPLGVVIDRPAKELYSLAHARLMRHQVTAKSRSIAAHPTPPHPIPIPHRHRPHILLDPRFVKLIPLT